MPRHESILPIYGLPVRQFDVLLCVEEGLSWNLSQVSVALVVKLTYFGAELETECATCRPTYASLDHAMLVVCGLTHILAVGSDCLGGGQLVTLITIHGRALFVDVNGLLACPALFLAPWLSGSRNTMSNHHHCMIKTCTSRSKRRKCV